MHRSKLVHLTPYSSCGDAEADDTDDATADTAQLMLAELTKRHREQSPRNDKPRRLSAFAFGFSLECAPSAEASDRKGLARLLRYGLRPPFAHDRIEQLPNGNISYRLRRPFHTGQTHVVIPPGDFIRRIAALIPPPRVHLVRYHGLFAPNAAFRAAACALVPKADDEANDIDDACPHRRSTSATSSVDVDDSSATTSEVDAPHRKRCRTAWAILLRRVFAVDVLRCPCGGTRRITAALTRNTEGDALERILRNIGEPTEPLPICPARGPPQTDFDWNSDPAQSADPMPDYDA